MPSIPELEDAFRAYLEEMERCVAGKCYWALLHMVLVLPDICGALEDPHGESSPNRYRSWCRRYLTPCSKLRPAQWYEMRCAVLHQGTTRTKARVTFSFSQPSTAGGVIHEVIEDDGAGGQIFRLDVGKLAETMKAALRDWFKALQDAKRGRVRAYIDANLPLLARVRTLPAPQSSVTPQSITPGIPIFTSTGAITASPPAAPPARPGGSST
jgi:hypothetical protein